MPGSSPDLFAAGAPSALVLLHLQNEVLDPAGLVGRRGIAAVAETAGLVEAVLATMAAARAAGAPIVHIQFVGHDGTCATTALNLRSGAADGFEPGGWGVRIVDRLAAADAVVMEHDTMSGFAGTALAALLREHGVQRVLLGGVSTHLVVAATAFAAADLGFDVVVLEDCCVAPSEATSAAALSQLRAIGRVASTVAQ